MTGFGRLTVSLVVLAVASAGSSPGGEVKVTSVVAGDRVLASFVAATAWGPEARDLLQSGLEVRFTFDVELQRPVTLLPDPTLARARVAATVKRDALTGAFQASRARDGQVDASERLDTDAAVRDWMTVFNQVALQPAEPLVVNADYYVRVRLSASPRRTVSLWSIWPFGRDDASGRADFTVVR
jgi:hypothetical protein